MDLFTLTPNFLKDSVIDEFSSAIWTERYGPAGDVSLVVDATPQMISKLAKGTFLALDGSKEVMLLETQSIENDLLTVTGNTLVAFLENRIVRTTLDHEVQSWSLPWMTPGEALATIVQEMCIGGVYLTGVPPDGTAGNPDEIKAIIPNLSIGDVDTSGDDVLLAIPFGQVYSALKTIAETYSIGMSLYLESADDSDYSLIFKSYKGRDLTSDQEVYPLVRFSPALDSLTDYKELQSVVGYKNVAHAFANPYPEGMTIYHGVAYADAGASTSLGFDRRVLLVSAGDISTELVTGSDLFLQALLTQKAKDGLANNNFTKVVDGEIVPQSEFQYGEHYELGDIIELQGNSGSIQKARITEYIRSQDKSGESAYPTISVID